VHSPSADLDIELIDFTRGGWQEHVLAEALRFRPDFVAIGGWGGFSYLLEPLKTLLPKVKIALEIKSPMLSSGEVLLKQQKRFAEALPYLDAIISPAKGMCDSWFPDENYRHLEHRSIINYSQIKAPKFAQTKVKPSKFVFTGSLASIREIDKLLDCFAQLNKSVSRRLSLDIFGDGAEKDALQHHADALGIADIVSFHGAVDQSELFERFSEFDSGIAWVPNQLFDSAPSLKLIEFCAAGLVPIASSNKGHRHLEKYGIEINYFDNSPENFEEVATHAIEEGIPVETLRNNRSLAKSFDYKNVVSKEIFPFYQGVQNLENKKNPDQATWLDIDQKPLENLVQWYPSTNPSPVGTTPAQKKKIFGIFSDRLANALAMECDLHLVERGAEATYINNPSCSSIILESCIEDSSGDWSLYASNPLPPETKKLLSAIKKKKKKVIFWFSLDISYSDMFSEMFSLADEIIVSDRRAYAQFEKGKKPVRYQGPVFQPRHYNPFRPIDAGEPDFNKLLINGLRTVDNSSTLASLMRLCEDLDFTAFERSKLPTANYVRKSDEKFTNITAKGAPSYQMLPSILKNAEVVLYTDDSRITPMELAWQAVENAGCGALTVFLGDLDRSASDALDLVISFEDWNSAADHLRYVYLNPQLCSLEKADCWRVANDKFLIKDAVRSLCKKKGQRVQTERSLKISVVSPTLRPENINTILENYDRQIYENKELVIVLNDDYDAYKELVSLESERDYLKIIFLPEDHSAATALNLGSRHCSGDYIFRFDDDDFYGENYLSDFITSIEAEDVDLFGKFGSFVFKEGSTDIYLREQTSRDKCNTVFRARDLGHPNAQLSGATFGIKAEILKDCGFPSDRLAAADTAFLAQLREKHPNSVVLKNDWVSYALGRAQNENSHTWHVEWAHLVESTNALQLSLSDIG
jgi:hypothetical protein